MNEPRKILIIDSASDRKERINALKSRGYGVFPTLRMEEARSRCTRGGYDLIIVNAGEDQERALQFGEDLRKQCPKQLLLVRTSGEAGRDYTVGPALDSLLQRVDTLLREEASPSDLASAA